MNAENITISIDEYLELLNDQRILECLRMGGVDNWDWYDASLESYEELIYLDISK